MRKTKTNTHTLNSHTNTQYYGQNQITLILFLVRSIDRFDILNQRMVSLDLSRLLLYLSLTHIRTGQIQLAIE